MTFDLVEVAEDGWGLMPRYGGIRRRDVTPEVILIDQPGSATFRLAIRIRFDEAGVERAIASVRAWFAEQGSPDFTWVVGTTSTPPGLAERLLADGAVPASEDPEMATMV